MTPTLASPPALTIDLADYADPVAGRLTGSGTLLDLPVTLEGKRPAPRPAASGNAGRSR